MFQWFIWLDFEQRNRIGESVYYFLDMNLWPTSRTLLMNNPKNRNEIWKEFLRFVSNFSRNMISPCVWVFLRETSAWWGEPWCCCGIVPGSRYPGTLKWEEHLMIMERVIYFLLAFAAVFRVQSWSLDSWSKSS
jgi:hypothetical protein